MGVFMTSENYSFNSPLDLGRLETTIDKKIDSLSRKTESEEGIVDVDKKINKLTNSINTYLSQVLDSDFIIDERKIDKTKEFTKKMTLLRDRIAQISPLTVDGIAAQKHLIDVCDKSNQLLMSAIKSIKHSSPFERREEPEFFLSYFEQVKAKRNWRETVFRERIDWPRCMQDPFSHPEYPIFKKEMRKCVDDEAKIDQMWTLTVKGIDLQLKFNNANRKNDANPFFEELANLLNREGLLSPNEHEPFALWSGGFEISLYAQSKGYTTLEKTKAGLIFDTLLLYPSWSLLGPLWNSLSSEFAKNSNDDAHIFFRVHDPLSVLERQEIPQIIKSPKAKITFHPIINRGYAMNALDVEELQLRPGAKAAIVLKNVLTKICKEAMKGHPDAASFYNANLVGIKQMKLD